MCIRDRVDPLEAGEPKYEFHQLKVTMRLIVNVPLAVEYCVLDMEHTVVIRSFRSTVALDNLPGLHRDKNGDN